MYTYRLGAWRITSGQASKSFEFAYACLCCRAVLWISSFFDSSGCLGVERAGEGLDEYFAIEAQGPAKRVEAYVKHQICKGGVLNRASFQKDLDGN